MAMIANTTIISNFAAVGQLELLHQRFTTLYLSEQVFEEIQNGLLQGYTFYSNLETQIFPFSSTGWLCLTALGTPGELQMYGQLLTNLHGGEASCLAIAFHRQWTLLSDDFAAVCASQENKTTENFSFRQRPHKWGLSPKVKTDTCGVDPLIFSEKYTTSGVIVGDRNACYPILGVQYMLGRISLLPTRI